MPDKPSDIILTLTVSPATNGKRKIVVSGAPAHEMPIVHAGTFADLHRLIDETWVELAKRKPQTVKAKEEKKATSSKRKAKKGKGPSPSEIDDQLVADQAAEDAEELSGPLKKAMGELEDAVANVPTDLPVIEGDEPNE